MQQPFLAEVTTLSESVGQVLPLADRLDQMCLETMREEGMEGIPTGRTMEPYDVSNTSKSLPQK